MFADRGPRMLQAYTGGAEVKSRVDIFVKDMGIVTTVGRTSHVPLPLRGRRPAAIPDRRSRRPRRPRRLQRRHRPVTQHRESHRAMNPTVLLLIALGGWPPATAGPQVQVPPLVALLSVSIIVALAAGISPKDLGCAHRARHGFGPRPHRHHHRPRRHGRAGSSSCPEARSHWLRH